MAKCYSEIENQTMRRRPFAQIQLNENHFVAQQFTCLWRGAGSSNQSRIFAPKPGRYQRRKFNIKPNVAAQGWEHAVNEAYADQHTKSELRLLTYKIKYRFAETSVISAFGYFYQCVLIKINDVSLAASP